MKKLIDQSEIENLCAMISAALSDANELGPRMDGVEPIYDLIQQLKDMADKLTCPCRMKFYNEG